MAEKTFIMAGGGTGGHIIPGLAVARELSSRGHRPVFVGTAKGLETKLVPDAGFPLELISVGALKGQGMVGQLRTLFALPAAVWQARRLLTQYQAAAVFSMGGYAAGPVGLAAGLAACPMLLMEPNAMPGFTNRQLGRWAKRALISFPEAAAYFPSGCSELTGLPVREAFFHISTTAVENVSNILVTGGSRGSQTLNRAVAGSLEYFRQNRLHLTWQTGAEQHATFAPLFAASGCVGEVVPFLSNMAEAYEKAHVIISRSGAGAVSELAAAGRASLLVPYPFAADDHQAKNAESMVRAGAARMVRDAACTPERLQQELEEFRQPGKAAEMAAAARRLARQGAAQRAADLLEWLAGGPKPAPQSVTFELPTLKQN